MSEPLAWQNVRDTAPYRIRTGVWTDWSYGRVMGLTLTLDKTTGSYLIAFTAVFISLAGSSFWRILRLALYRSYSTLEPGDTLHHQRQVLLRNSITAPASLWAFSQLGWTWRQSGCRAWLRTLPAILCAIFSIAAFAAASGLSSRLFSSLSRAVLIDGSKCGLPTGNVGKLENKTVFYTGIREAMRIADLSRHYAEQCYTGKPTGVSDCITYIQPRLSSLINRYAPCPFSAGICRSNSSNLRLDTGLIDSHHHLGINAPFKDRFQIRFVAHCAPLITEGFAKRNSTRHGNYTEYYYGPLHLFEDESTPYTYQVEDVFGQYRHVDEDVYSGLAVNPEVQLWSVFSPVINGKFYKIPLYSFEPIPQLQRPDGDLNLYMLSGNGIVFSNPSDDIWYRITYGYSENFWRPQEAASPLACLMQTQLCNFKGRCGPLASFTDAIVGAASLSSSDPIRFEADGVSIDLSDSFRLSRSAQRFFWLANVLQSVLTSPISGLEGPKAEDLMSMKTKVLGVTFSLASNAWQTDMTHLWAIFLARFQAAFVLFAAGATDPDRSALVEDAPDLVPVREWCNNQKILSSDHMSFSLLWLLITYILGILIMVTSYIIEPIYEILWRRWRYREHQFLEWASDEALQLHRAAHQGIDSGVWQGFTDAVPRNKREEPLADLALHYTEADALRTANDDAGNELEQQANTNNRRLNQSQAPAGNHRYSSAESETNASSATLASDRNLLGHATSAAAHRSSTPMRPWRRDKSISFSRRFPRIFARRGANRSDAYELHDSDWPETSLSRTGRSRSEDRHGQGVAA
ncbi:hypothetical protein CDD83_5824 [Cordyceps sp. RAO-2017]|nr:hypothetical protein CDD83_5824 [Cordyceps sp. RAO-2017]